MADAFPPREQDLDPALQELAREGLLDKKARVLERQSERIDALLAELERMEVDDTLQVELDIYDDYGDILDTFQMTAGEWKSALKQQLQLPRSERTFTFQNTYGQMIPLLTSGTFLDSWTPLTADVLEKRNKWKQEEVERKQRRVERSELIHAGVPVELFKETDSLDDVLANIESIKKIVEEYKNKKSQA